MQSSWYSVTKQYEAVGLPGSVTLVSLCSSTDLYTPRTSVLMTQSVPQGHQPPKLVQDAQSGTLQSCQHGLDFLHRVEHCFLLTVSIFVMWSIGFTVLMLGSKCNAAGHKKLRAEGQKGLWNSTAQSLNIPAIITKVMTQLIVLLTRSWGWTFALGAAGLAEYSSGCKIQIHPKSETAKMKADSKTISCR